jgi:hypothetical protein
VAARPRPGWGHQTSLFQFREPAFWLYVLLLAVTAGITVRQQGALRAVAPSAWALSWTLLALYLLPMVAFVYLLDLYEREPPSLVAGALVYGAVCATALAGLANDGWSAVLAHLAGHVLYSGLVGMAVAWFVTRRGEQPAARRLAVAAGLVALAVLGHFLWNSPWLDLFPSPGPLDPLALGRVLLAAAVKGLPFLAVLVVLLALARRRESHWLAVAVGTEVGGPGLHHGELEVLRSPRRRRRARIEARRAHGRAAAAGVRRLHRAQIRLAMIRTRVGDDDHPDLVRQRELCQSLRERLPGGGG